MGSRVKDWAQFLKVNGFVPENWSYNQIKHSDILKEIKKNYTLHHMNDFDPETLSCTVQLVKKNAHDKTADVAGIAHEGAVSDYQKFTGKNYK